MTTGVSISTQTIPSTRRADWREVLSLSFPLLIASSADLAMNVVDTILAGRLDASGFAAVASGAAAHSIASQGVAASLIGYQIVAQRRMGGGGPEAVSAAFRGVFAAILVVGALVTAIGFFAAPHLIGVISPDDAVVSMGSTYLRYRLLGLIPWALLLLFRSTFDANKQTGIGMRVVLIMNLANAAVSYALMFGTGPIPALGAPGAAIGSSTADAVGLGAILLYGKRTGILRRLRSVPGLRASLTELRTVGSLSGPEVVSSLLDYGGGLVFFAVIGGLGAAALGAGRLAYTVMLVLFVGFFTLGLATQILAGRAFGEGTPDRAYAIYRRSIELVVGVGLIVSIMTVLWSTQIAGLLTTIPAAQADAAPAVLLMGLTAPLIGITTVSVGMLRALGLTRTVMMVNVAAVWLLQLPVAWLAIRFTTFGVAGAFAGLLAYFAFRAAVSVALARRRGLRPV